MDTLYHLADPQAWADAERTGRYTGSTKGLDLAEVGFVHCSFRSQLPGVAAALYAETPALVLLAIDPEQLGGAPVRVEPVPGGEQRFPHVYGPIPTAAVTSRTQVRVDEHGEIHPAPIPPGAGWPDANTAAATRPRVRPAAAGWTGPGTAPTGSTRSATG